MRIAVVYKDEARINAQYRGLIPAGVLAQRGHELAWYGPSSELPPVRELTRCDLVHVYRAAEPTLIAALKRLRENGVAISWDNDDDVTLLPKESPTYRRHGGLVAEHDFTWQARAIRLADLVTTTSDVLAERYRRAGARHVAVIDNFLPRDFLRGGRERHDGVVLGWTAGLEHGADARLLNLRPLLLALLNEHPELRVVTLGLRLELDHPRYEHRRGVEFLRMPDVVRGFDVGIAPLADIPFNRARSSVKVKEYAAAGVPWLASPVGPYGGLGPKQGGRLVPENGWAQAIGQLVRHRRERVALGTRGRLWAHQQAIQHNVQGWEEAFAAAVRRTHRHSATAACPRAAAR